MQAARDEAHRFAVSYNRGLRRRRTLQSELSQVVGVGPKREKELLRRFGSVAAIRRLSIDDLASVPGIGRDTASRILDGLSTGMAR
jgi:excinuclease ABC subunit C